MATEQKTDMHKVNILENTDGLGKWSLVVNKKKLKRKRQERRRKMREQVNRGDFQGSINVDQKKPQELWYDNESWQFKLLNDKYILGDNSSILEKYSCLELKEEFEQCRNNYRRNNVYRKLMKVVTSDEWIKIKEHVSERQTEE